MQPCLVGLLIAAPALAQDAAPRDEAAESRVGRCRLEYGACGVGECKQATIETGNASAEHCTTYLHRGHRRSVCRSTVAGAHARARHVRAVDRDVPRKAIARGITDDTYTRVMAGLHPDTTGLSAIHNQAEFKQQLWQYLNRATTDWKITAGKAASAAIRAAFCPHRKGFRRRASVHARRLGYRVRIRRSGRREESHASRSFRRWRHWPGPNRAGVPIGKANSSMR